MSDESNDDDEVSARAITSTNPGSRILSAAEAKSHATRMKEHRSRLSHLRDESRLLVSHLGKSNILRKIQSTAALVKFKYELGEPAEYGTISQSNLPGFSSLLEATLDEDGILVHAIELSDLTTEYRRQLHNEGLKILHYFGSYKSGSQGSTQKSNYFLQIMDIFLVEKSEQALVMHEWFTVDMSMQHKLWSGKWSGTYRTLNVKHWAIQVAEAVEILNRAGVVHRFVRPENILLIPHRNSPTTIKLTSFDFACRYWDVESRTSIGLGPKLPIDLEPHLLDHLPPECFSGGYDGSMVDVWSIGTMICLMMTDENPFEVRAEGDEAPPMNYIQQWKRCEERFMLPEELRSLLDDIFKDANTRICAWELAKDDRLCKSTKELNKVKLPSYYRIDLTKNINLEGPELAPPAKEVFSKVDMSDFSPESNDIFAMKSVYKKLKYGEEAEIKDYRVLREASFEGDDLSPSVIMNDYYLKAARSGQTEADCLVKIVPLHRIPLRQRNLLLNESNKIMDFMSGKSATKCHIHRVLDMYELVTLSDSYLYIFYEHLQQHQSIYHVVLSPSSKFPPPLQSTDSLLSLTNIQVWVHSLAQTVLSMVQLGVAHRYIRPEYVFVSKTEPSKIKLSHFDQACFVWTPPRSFLVRRTCGIQDEKEHLWNHLPPECHDPLYDCRQVDVWSVAVLLAFCLTGKMPFSSPLTMSQATTQWAQFKRDNSSSFWLPDSPMLIPFTQLLDSIFVPEEERLKAAQLVDMSVASKLIPQPPSVM